MVHIVSPYDLRLQYNLLANRSTNTHLVLTSVVPTEHDSNLYAPTNKEIATQGSVNNVVVTVTG